MSARSYTLDKRRQGNITVTDLGGVIVVKLHNTDIVKYDKDLKIITLNSGGYRTMTTKTAINRALKLLGAWSSVSQVKGIWYLCTREFQDHMKLRLDTPVTHNVNEWDYRE